MKKTIYMILLLTGIVTMTACSNPIKGENADLDEEVTQVVEENQELKEQIIELEEEKEELAEEIVKLDPDQAKEEDPVADKQEEPVMIIYGTDENTYEREVLKEVSIEDDLSLEERLEVIADNISQEQFEGLGIELSKIEEEDGKKIGVINLTEKPNDTDASWLEGYFQGSTGGIVTTVALEESFLQKEYNGEWIDGVRFLYNDEKLQFDHVESLGEITYR